ncbi:hypothetical protein PFTANZ_05989, partial [Plasmodium falciparum Tanzania (2000708)]
WIDNQRKQFDKQKQRYENVINGTSRSSRAKRAARGGSDHKGYEKIFYDKLQETEYKDVGEFLEKLSKDKACEKVKDGGTINFKTVNSGSASGGTAGGGDSGGTSGDSGTNNENKGTFYRSEYCQPCPHCGVKHDGNQWEKKNDENCKSGKLYEPTSSAIPTDITILKSGEGHEDIEKKLNAFCLTQNGNDGGAGGTGTSGSQDLYEEWKCYKEDDIEKNGDDDEDYENEVKGSGGICILETTNHEGVQKQKTYNDFFNFWVAHMLKDSIHWRTRRLRKCINDGTTMKCINGCNTKCDCFEKWIKQKKKEEWTKIRNHFYTQKGFGEEVGQEIPHYIILEGVLEEEFLKE